MVYAQPRIYPGQWNAQTPLGFWETNVSPYLSQTTRPYDNQQKKKEKKKKKKERERERENLQNCGLCYPGSS